MDEAFTVYSILIRCPVSIVDVTALHLIDTKSSFNLHYTVSAGLHTYLSVVHTDYNRFKSFIIGILPAVGCT